MDALIGHTGFVGSNLRRQHRFHGEFNSSTIDTAIGQQFDLAVCAAAPAAMWAANRDPDHDRANIELLLDKLRRIEINRIVLISTIAVLDKPDAGYTESSARYEQQLAYGRNRRLLEQAIQSDFSNCHVLRLPALFGTGLKKNFLFDLLNPAPSFLTIDKFDEITARLTDSKQALLRQAYAFDDALEIFKYDRDQFSRAEERQSINQVFDEAGFTSLHFVNKQNAYQYYNLERLWSDIEICVGNNIPVMHLAPEPIEAEDISRSLTGEPLPGSSAPAYREDMRTEHGAFWNSETCYIEDRDHVLSGLKDFYAWAGRAA